MSTTEPTPATMQAWRTHAYGPPGQALHLDTVPVPVPAAGQVRVRVEAVALNLNDLERITGGNMMVEPELPYSPGMEVFGVVDAVGDGADAWMGRRVAAMPVGAHGGYAEFAVCPTVATFEIPDEVQLPEAAAVFFPFHLAWLGLVERAHLRAGETVLVHAGAGGSGSAAIQVAVERGARVIATAGSDEKAQRCRDLGADVACNSRTADIAAVALDATDGRGVDVVFDNVGEAVMEASLRAVAYGGRYLMMGFASNKAVADEPSVVPRRLATANVALLGVLLAYADDATRELVKATVGWNLPPEALGRQIHAEVTARVVAGSLRPVVGDVVRFADIPGAVEALAGRRTVGRTVVLVDRSAAGEPVSAAPRPRPSDG